MKRILDLVLAVLALSVLFPLMLLVAIWIKLDSRGPIIFRQERIGRNGIPFAIFKFRTMSVRENDGEVLITKSTDSRITSCGKFLRELKIDELPQFVNVVFGQMSVVGPRPEVRKYVDQFPDSIRKKVLSVKPGITDNAAIAFRDEGMLLAAADDLEREYVERILPKKLSLYVSYIDNQSVGGDLIIVFRTLVSMLRRPKFR